ncbi:MAG: 3-deoxy-8-phosphooctulonate synthase [Gemmatimonadales bacterium]
MGDSERSLFEAPFLIAGPCVLEDDSTNLRIAEQVAETGRRLGLSVIFKASFDKANRSSLQAPRGPGLEAGLTLLEAVKREVGLPILTDIHEPSQAATVATVADVLQIPAFLARQTDLLVSAGNAARYVNVKKGQWLDAAQMAGSVSKVRSGRRVEEIAVTERGSFFGYGDLVVDFRNLRRLREECSCPAIFDITHAAPRKGSGGVERRRSDRDRRPGAGRRRRARRRFLRGGASGSAVEPVRRFYGTGIGRIAAVD